LRENHSEGWSWSEFTRRSASGIIHDLYSVYPGDEELSPSKYAALKKLAFSITVPPEETGWGCYLRALIDVST